MLRITGIMWELVAMFCLVTAPTQSVRSEIKIEFNLTFVNNLKQELHTNVPKQELGNEPKFRTSHLAK